MREQDIIFHSVEEVQQFVNQAEQCQGDVDVSLGSCIVDGKSLLGVLSLGIHKKLHVTVHSQP